MSDSASEPSARGDASGPGEPPWAVELLELLARQHGLYRELHKLAQRQRGLIGAEDPTALLNVLSARQKLIDELAEINRRLEPARADWKRIEQTLTTEQRRRASRLLEQVGDLLTVILAADEADSQTLSARKAVAARQIQSTAASAQVQAAYRRAAGAVGRPDTGGALDRSSD